MATDPATDATTDPATDPATDATTDPATDPATDATTDPATDPATDPVAPGPATVGDPPEDPAHDPVLPMRTAVLAPGPLVADRRPMPTDFRISVASHGAVDQRIVEPGARPRRQPMRGFEETFTDIVDFILRVTHHIWEEKAIGYLYEHYRHSVGVVDDEGAGYGRERVIEGTAQFLSAFPDARLFGDEVIWCGDEDLGFSTSHRVMIVGHNTGYSRYGPPTGRRVAFWCIANCRSIDNQIVDEHVIYNTGSLLRQLGRDLTSTARELARRDVPAPARLEAAGDVDRLLGQGHPARPPAPLAGEDIGTAVRRALAEIWNWRLVDRVATHYAPGFRWHGPVDRELTGVAAYQAYVLELLSMFPDLAHRVDDVYWMGNDAEGYLVATRWTLTGTHRGSGHLGQPTGRRVVMWGLTHQRIVDRRIVEEWTVSNEFDVLVQLHRPEVPGR